jgi:hypothetical protein
MSGPRQTQHGFWTGRAGGVGGKDDSLKLRIIPTIDLLNKKKLNEALFDNDLSNKVLEKRKLIPQVSSSLSMCKSPSHMTPRQSVPTTDCLDNVISDSEINEVPYDQNPPEIDKRKESIADKGIDGLALLHKDVFLQTKDRWSIQQKTIYGTRQGFGTVYGDFKGANLRSQGYLFGGNNDREELASHHRIQFEKCKTNGEESLVEDANVHTLKKNSSGSIHNDGLPSLSRRMHSLSKNKSIENSEGTKQVTYIQMDASSSKADSVIHRKGYRNPNDYTALSYRETNTKTNLTARGPEIFQRKGKELFRVSPSTLPSIMQRKFSTENKNFASPLPKSKVNEILSTQPDELLMTLEETIGVQTWNNYGVPSTADGFFDRELRNKVFGRHLNNNSRRQSVTQVAQTETAGKTTTEAFCNAQTEHFDGLITSPRVFKVDEFDYRGISRVGQIRTRKIVNIKFSNKFKFKPDLICNNTSYNDFYKQRVDRRGFKISQLETKQKLRSLFTRMNSMDGDKVETIKDIIKVGFLAALQKVLAFPAASPEPHLPNTRQRMLIKQATLLGIDVIDNEDSVNPGESNRKKPNKEKQKSNKKNEKQLVKELEKRIRAEEMKLLNSKLKKEKSGGLDGSPQNGKTLYNIGNLKSASRIDELYSWSGDGYLGLEGDSGDYEREAMLRSLRRRRARHVEFNQLANKSDQITGLEFFPRLYSPTLVSMRARAPTIDKSQPQQPPAYTSIWLVMINRLLDRELLESLFTVEAMGYYRKLKIGSNPVYPAASECENLPYDVQETFEAMFELLIKVKEDIDIDEDAIGLHRHCDWKSDEPYADLDLLCVEEGIAEELVTAQNLDLMVGNEWRISVHSGLSKHHSGKIF